MHPQVEEVMKDKKLEKLKDQLENQLKNPRILKKSLLIQEKGMDKEEKEKNDYGF